MVNLCSFLWFTLTGIIQLFLKNFVDIYAFYKDCWNEDHHIDFSPNVAHSRVSLKEEWI